MKPNTLTLIPQQLHRLDARAGLRLEVLSGRIWLTRPQDARDHFLDAGATLDLYQDRVLIASEPTPSISASAQVRLRPLAAAPQPDLTPAPRPLALGGLAAAGRR